jgi:hypothetical protein
VAALPPEPRAVTIILLLGIPSPATRSAAALARARLMDWSSDVCSSDLGKSQNRRADLSILLPESRETLPFASNEAALIARGLSPSVRVNILNKIINIAESLKNDNRARLLVVGYANPVVGTARELRETLLPLSRQRAAEAAEMIALEGVDRGRIITIGAGAVPSSRRSRNAAENRFVDLIILK